MKSSIPPAFEKHPKSEEAERGATFGKTKANGATRGAHISGFDTQIQRAKARTEQAEARTELAKTRTEQAEMRTEQAETRTDEAKTRTEQAEARTEQLQSRTEDAETRSKLAIQASDLSYRRLFEAARDGILILEADTGRINDVNPFLVELLGFSRLEILGKTVGELSPFKDMESNKAMLERLQKDGYVRYEDLPLETRDGRHIDVEFVSNVYQAGHKSVIQCNVRDITARKRAETVSNRLASIVESSNDAIIGKDLNGIVTNWNKSAENIFGYTAAEMIGSPIGLMIPAGKLDEEDQLLAKLKRGETVAHFETQRRAKDGRLIDISLTVSAIKDAAGKVIGFSKVARNISERKEAEEKIHQLNVELEGRVAERTSELLTANQDLEAFSYSVSHDLRAPLRHVMGYIQILEKEAGPSLSKSSLERMATISGAAARMGILIDDLMAFSRIGRMELRKSDVDLHELVRQVQGDFMAETETRGILWKIDLLPTVRADAALLRMVLANLIANAVKFTGARAQAQIEIGCLPTGKQETVIFIRDNGAGFDPLYADKLFGVFQRLHSQAEFEGTGIGLANVYRIIHRHGGRTWAEGIVDGGATFYFSIPK